MIRSIIASALIFSIFFQTGMNTGMNLWYHLANKSFEKAFCENIEKPEKSCHGSCKMKKINQAPPEKNNWQHASLDIRLNLSQFIVEPIQIPVFYHNNRNIKNQTRYIFNYSLDSIEEYFHPPEFHNL